MSQDGGQSGGRDEAKGASGDCPLSYREQSRNILIYAANWGLIYLSSPVTYVGITQATLVDRLGYRSEAANLPASAFLWSMPLAVVVIWAFPRIGSLKGLLVGALLSAAAMGLAVTAAVLWGTPRVVVAALVAHAVVWGCGNGVFATCQWEMIGRGVAPGRRGQALGLAFGAGPVLAVVASFSQFLVTGTFLGRPLPDGIPRVEYPWNFAGLYLASVVVLAAAAAQSCFFVVPRADAEADVRRPPFLKGVFGGFGEFLGSRLIVFAALAYVLVYSGQQVMQNISLYTREALGASPEDYAGLQLTLRFGFKIAAGFFLGWLLVKTSPKALLQATAGLTFAGVLWALIVPGPAFLIAFGVLGAGELFGVYYPNYILDCSPRRHLRRNMVFTGMITVAVGFAPVLYGRISDTLGRSNPRLGFQASFVTSLAILATAMLIVWLTLPAKPQPPDDLPTGGEGMTDPDAAREPVTTDHEPIRGTAR
jgi:hypothetical protein